MLLFFFVFSFVLTFFIITISLGVVTCPYDDRFSPSKNGHCYALSYAKVQAQRLGKAYAAALPYEASFNRGIYVLVDAASGGTFMSSYYDSFARVIHEPSFLIVTISLVVYMYMGSHFLMMTAFLLVLLH